MNAEQVVVEARGSVLLPDDLRTKYRLEPGETLQVLDLGGAILLTPGKLRVDELGDQFQELMDRAGVTEAELLDGLSSQRSRYNRERGHS